MKKNKILIHVFIVLFLSRHDLVFSESYDFESLIKQGGYVSFDVDIDKDGKHDKIITQTSDNGDDLIFFKRKNDTYLFSLKSNVLIQDGGNVIHGIYNTEENYIVVETIEPRLNNHIARYFIGFFQDEWFLKKIIHNNTYPLYDYTKTYICEVDHGNINLNDKVAIEAAVASVPTESFIKKCPIKYFVEDNLKEFIERFDSDEATYLGLNRYKSLFNRFPLTIKNVTDYNNIAYYLEKNGAYEESAYILEKIVTHFPERVVAYINLGDAYWKLNLKGKAVKTYRLYIKKMKEKNKKKRIPSYVYERI